MAVNKRFDPGWSMAVPVDAPVVPTGGDAVLVGQTTGVAVGDLDPATGLTVVDFGPAVWWLPVMDNAGTGVTPGDLLYIDDTGLVDNISTNAFFGFSLGTVPLGLGDVILVAHVSSITIQGMENAIGGALLGQAAPDQPVPSPPVVFWYQVPDMATGELDFDLDQSVLVTDVWIKKVINNASAHAHTIQLQTVGGAENITNAMSLNAVARGGIVRATNVLDDPVAAGADAVRIDVVRANAAGQIACDVYVQGLKM